VALIPSHMMMLFRDWGVNSAMTRFILCISHCTKQNHHSTSTHSEEDPQNISCHIARRFHTSSNT
jgi:bisphosphoglycerate-independent phosphoglycerate mutase (AlkP superfamily)